MYRVEIMMRYGQNQHAKNILYPHVLEYSINDNGFFNIKYQANEKTYNRGIAIGSIVAYTVSDDTLSRKSIDSEEPYDDSADN